MRSYGPSCRHRSSRLRRSPRKLRSLLGNLLWSLWRLSPRRSPRRSPRWSPVTCPCCRTRLSSRPLRGERREAGSLVVPQTWRFVKALSLAWRVKALKTTKLRCRHRWTRRPSRATSTWRWKKSSRVLEFSSKRRRQPSIPQRGLD